MLHFNTTSVVERVAGHTKLHFLHCAALCQCTSNVYLLTRSHTLHFMCWSLYPDTSGQDPPKEETLYHVFVSLLHIS